MNRRVYHLPRGAHTQSIREGTSSIKAQAVADLLNRASNDIVPAVTKVVVRNLYVKALRELWGDRGGGGGEKDRRSYGMYGARRTVGNGSGAEADAGGGVRGTVELSGGVVVTDSELDVVSRGAYAAAFG